MTEANHAGGGKAPASMTTVVAASTAGTAFEWYDFFLFVPLAAIMSKTFFSGLPETTAYIFALGAFAVGFAFRPIGALIFGRIGDRIGRKATFLVTMILMGMSTFCIGLIPTSADISAGVPAEGGHRYSRQVAEAARLAAASLGVPDYDLVWQSRSGPPSVPWLEPDVLDHLDVLHAKGVSAVLVCPIGFVSDHVEVVWDLDHEARERAAVRRLRREREAVVAYAVAVGADAVLAPEGVLGRPEWKGVSLRLVQGTPVLAMRPPVYVTDEVVRFVTERMGQGA